MADYKLRLDVDAKLLEQALEKAVKKAFGKIPSMSGGGIGGGFGGMGGVTKHQKVEQKFQKISQKMWKDDISKRKKNEHEMRMIYIKEKAALRAHNIMLEKSGVQMARTFRNLGQLAGGRMGGTAGTVMDMGFQKLSSARRSRRNIQEAQRTSDAMIGPRPKGFERPELKGGFNSVMGQIDKFKETGTGKAMSANFNAFKKTKGGGAAVGIASKVPQMVKLAGIGAALAGGAGLGKMIVDSSPMLKAMLKLLNVGVMLILRPIGDFIGFMLRPLLLHFVTRVAIPAYKSGSKLAKEWGTKMGKVLLLMFTNPEQFLKGALLDPLFQAMAKMTAGLHRRLQILGVMMSPWIIDKDAAINDIATQQFDSSNPMSDQAIQKKYPGFFYDDEGLEGGLLGGLADTETGKRLQELQEMTTEELNMGNAKTDKVIENTKAAGDAVSDLEDKVIIGNESQQQTADNTAELVRLAQEAALAEIARTNANNAKQDEIMDDQKEFFEENPYIPTIALGSQAIEKAAKDKEDEAIDARYMKKYGQLVNADGSLSVNIASLSPEAQKRLNEATRMKDPLQNGPIAGGREGTNVNPIATSAMGQYYESERYRTGEETNPNNYTYLQEDSEYRSFGVETREGARMYTEAIKEAALNGTEVADEWDIMVEESEKAARDAKKIADAQEAAQQAILDKNDKMLNAASDSASLALQSNDEHKEIFNLTAQSKDLTCLSTSLTEETMWMIAKAHGYVTNLMRSLGLKGSNPYVAPSTPEEEEEDDGDEEPSHHAGLTKYKVLFADGDPLEKLLTAREKMVFQSHSNNGTIHPSYPDRGVVKSITKMARGGIIGEKIFGIGQSTGQGYIFGESGPETVTPGVGGTVNNRGGSTFNITINASNVGDIERQLKPAILKMLKESTSRAGIV